MLAKKHIHSVPVNRTVPLTGTPLQNSLSGQLLSGQFDLRFPLSGLVRITGTNGSPLTGQKEAVKSSLTGQLLSGQFDLRSSLTGLQSG